MTHFNMRHEPERSRIDAEAAEWLIRKGEGPLLSSEQAAFTAWYAEDVRHAQAFAAVSRVRKDAANLGHLAHLIPQIEESISFRTRVVSEVVRFSRPAVGFAMAAAVVAVVFLAPRFYQVMELPQYFETRVGESRTVQLDDGSTITLGAHSKIQVVFSPALRRVKLVEGQAFFDVVHRPDREFVVEAGDTVIRDIGTKFDVNRTESNLEVSVLEGTVEIQAAAPVAVSEGPPRLVQAGQRVEAITRKNSGAHPIVAILAPVHVAKEAASSWREGRLVYENARLADIAADVNRYYAPGLHVSPDAADIRVTASFRTDAIAGFLSSLATVLPISMSKEWDGAFRAMAAKDSVRSGDSVPE